MAPQPVSALEHQQRLAWQREVGPRLRPLREVLKFDQANMAAYMGVDRSAWGKYEAGSLTPNVYKLHTFCDTFGVSLEYLLRGLLIGVHPGLAPLLAAADPEAVHRTTQTLEGLGIRP